MQNQNAQPRRPTLPEITAIIVVADGLSIAKSVGFEYSACSSGIVRQIEAALATRLRAALEAQAINMASAAADPSAPPPPMVDPSARPVVRAPAKGRFFFVSSASSPSSSSSSSSDEHGGDELSRVEREQFLEKMKTRAGWNVVDKFSKPPTGQEITATIGGCLLPKIFEPTGADIEPKSATDVVLVLGGGGDGNDDDDDSNIVGFLRSSLPKNVRAWCFAAKEAHRSDDLEDWGRETNRLVELRLPKRAVSSFGSASTTSAAPSPQKNPAPSSSPAAAAAAASSVPDDAKTDNTQKETATGTSAVTTTILRAKCPSFDTCSNPRCLLRHGDNRKRVCESQIQCCSADCPKLHFSVHVRGIKDGPVLMNKLAPTEGKRRALISGGWVLPICPFSGGATCPSGERCRALHFMDEQEAMTRAASDALCGAVPEDHILVDGIPVALTRLENTEGLRNALKQQKERAGKSCPKHTAYLGGNGDAGGGGGDGNIATVGCQFGESCPMIHFARADRGSSAANNVWPSSSMMGARSSSGMIMTPSDQQQQHRVAPTKNVSNLLEHGQQQQQQLSACCVCADEFPVSVGVCCTDLLHFTCEDCLSSFITISWVNIPNEPGTVPDVKCPSAGCVCSLTDVQVCRHGSEAAVGVYLQKRQDVRDALASARAMQLATDMIRRSASASAKDPAERELLKQQLRGQFPNALMCPRCSAGPYDFADCDDLQTHHGEQHGKHQIDNSCRHCKFFAETRSEWLKWDGIPRLDVADLDIPVEARVNAKNDEDLYDYEEDEEMQETPLWEQPEQTRRRRERARLRRQHRRATIWGDAENHSPEEDAVPPGCGAWMHATSGRNIEVLFHSSGTIQLVFARDALGWLLAMRTPAKRQQTLYSDGFFVDGAETRAVAMELNRNYREENMGHHQAPVDGASLLDGFVRVKKLDGVYLLEIGGSGGTSGTPGAGFPVVLHPSYMMLPTMNVTVDAECNQSWYFYSPMMVKQTRAQEKGEPMYDDDGDDDDSDEEDDAAVIDEDAYAAKYAKRNQEIKDLTQDLILIHNSGKIAIALNTESNGWFNFLANDNTEQLMLSSGNTAAQSRASLSKTWVPDVNMLVPVSRMTLGPWQITRDGASYRGNRITLNRNGFQYLKNTITISPAEEKDTHNFIDSRIERALSALTAGARPPLPPTPAGAQTLGAMLLEPPPMVRSNVGEDELELMKAIAGTNQRLVDCAREVLMRFRTGDEAAMFLQWCVELQHDPKSGASYASYRDQQRIDAQALTSATTTTTTTTTGNDDDKSRPAATTTTSSALQQHQDPTTTTTAAVVANRNPTEEELDLVSALTGQQRAICMNALRNFDAEQAVQFVFYCADENKDNMNVDSVQSFRRVLNRRS